MAGIPPVGRSPEMKAGAATAIDKKYALDFARKSPAERINIYSGLSAGQKEALIANLIAVINDPQRSNFDEKGRSISAQTEVSPNGAQVLLAVEALKGIGGQDPIAAIKALRDAFSNPSSTDKVKWDYVRVLEYIGNKKPAHKDEIIGILGEYIKDQKRFPYSSYDQANRAQLRLKGLEEPPGD